jgi:hypothetical protein
MKKLTCKECKTEKTNREMVSKTICTGCFSKRGKQIKGKKR